MWWWEDVLLCYTSCYNLMRRCAVMLSEIMCWWEGMCSCVRGDMSEIII